MLFRRSARENVIIAHTLQSWRSLTETCKYMLECANRMLFARARLCPPPCLFCPVWFICSHWKQQAVVYLGLVIRKSLTAPSEKYQYGGRWLHSPPLANTKHQQSSVCLHHWSALEILVKCLPCKSPTTQTVEIMNSWLNSYDTQAFTYVNSFTLQLYWSGTPWCNS